MHVLLPIFEEGLISVLIYKSILFDFTSLRHSNIEDRDPIGPPVSMTAPLTLGRATSTR